MSGRNGRGERKGEEREREREGELERERERFLDLNFLSSAGSHLRDRQTGTDRNIKTNSYRGALRVLCVQVA